MSFLFVNIACERAKETQDTLSGPAPLGQEVSPDQNVKSDQPVETPSLSVANVVLYPKEGDKIVLTVEVAQSIEERRQGLQGRENLGEKHGMWFIFPEDGQEPFWMKDTPISLDILFVDSNYKVVEIIANTIPNSELLLVPRQKYRYALEVKAGSAEAFKINVGDRVEYRLGPP